MDATTQPLKLFWSGSLFLPSNKPYDWLGSGVYFWEDDVARAYQWSLEHRRHAPCVVGAAIELGHCLDLTKQSGIQAVKTAHALHLKLLLETGQQPPVNRAAEGSRPGDFVLRYLDRAVINYLHDSYAIAAQRNQGKAQEFDTVRAMFPEGEPIYATSGFMEKTVRYDF